MNKRSGSEILLGFILLLLIGARTPYADKVVMKDGKEISGTIVSDNENKVEIEVSGVKLALPKERIKSIEKLDPAERAINEGNSLFAGRKYPEAIKAYSRAMEMKPVEAQARIEAVKKAMAQAEDDALGTMPLAEAEKILRRRLGEPGVPDAETSQTKAQLAAVLMKRADQAILLKRDYAQSTKYLEEAWRLAPETAGLALVFVHSLEKDTPNDPRITKIIQSHLARNPDDVDAGEILVNQTWRSDPWTALKIVYPGNKINPKATKTMTDRLPAILLACFNSKPYPTSAPMDRVACYEALLRVKPDASRELLLQARAEKEPANLQHPYDLAVLHMQGGQLEQARDTFERIQRVDPKFKDAATKAGEVQRLIYERDIKNEEVQIQALEQLFQQVGGLSAADFPAMQDATQNLESVKPLVGLLAKRPLRKPEDHPTSYTHALKQYHAALSRNQAAAAQILSESRAQKAKIEADKQRELAQKEAERRKELAAQRESLILQYIGQAEQPSAGVQVSNFRKEESFRNGQSFSDISVGDLKVFGPDRKLQFHGTNLRVRNGKVVSGNVLYPR